MTRTCFLPMIYVRLWTMPAMAHLPASPLPAHKRPPEVQVGTGSLTAAGTTSRTNPLAGEIKNMKFRLIVSFIFMIPLMYIAMGHMVGLRVPSILTGEENTQRSTVPSFFLQCQSFMSIVNTILMATKCCLRERPIWIP